jgi:hypothetical protein
MSTRISRDEENSLTRRTKRDGQTFCMIAARCKAARLRPLFPRLSIRIWPARKSTLRTHQRSSMRMMNQMYKEGEPRKTNLSRAATHHARSPRRGFGR